MYKILVKNTPKINYKIAPVKVKIVVKEVVLLEKEALEKALILVPIPTPTLILENDK